MRGSSNIVQGTFCGAEIEPGTFHHWWPTFPLEPDRSTDAADQCAGPRDVDVESSSPAGMEHVPQLAANLQPLPDERRGCLS